LLERLKTMGSGRLLDECSAYGACCYAKNVLVTSSPRVETIQSQAILKANSLYALYQAIIDLEAEVSLEQGARVEDFH